MTVLNARRVATLLGGLDASRAPAYRAVADGLRGLIAEGRVPVGARLPSERDLTGALGLSRTTITRAYDLLREQGYLVSRQGSGSVTRLPLSIAGRTDRLLMPHDGAEDAIDLTIAAPGAPPGTAAAYERALAQLHPYLGGSGYYPTGVPALRDALAQRFASRGLPTRPEQIVVVSGALAGMAIASHALLRTGDKVLVETPTYPNAIQALRGRGVRLRTTSVDPLHGWDLEASVAAARGVRAAYLVPDFHNPTGALMEDRDRETLGEALTAAGAVALVDESVVDVCLDDRPMPTPLAHFAPDAITVGSASKGFWGGLRIGWLRVPEHRLDLVTSARISLDLASPALEQLVMLELLAEEPSIRAHHRATLNDSRDALVGALAERLPDWRVRPGRGGLALWCRLPEPRSTALAVAAERHGLHVPSGVSFAPEGGLEHWTRLPHALPPETMVEAVRRLALAWDDALADRAMPSRPRGHVVA